jgi:hypothetical protein
LSEQGKIYAVVVSRTILDDLRQYHVPERYFDCIFLRLEELGSNPTEKGVRCTHPRPGTKQFDFECDDGEHGFYFRAFFYMRQGETHICVYRLTAAAGW